MLKNQLKPYILLSILPLVYLANTLETALFMGLVYIVLSALVFYGGKLIDKVSEGRVRMYTYILLAATLITMATTILNTFFTLNQMMGIYLALTLFMIPKLKSEPLQEQKFVVYLLMVLVGFATLLVIGFTREFLGTGSIALASFGLDPVQVFNQEFAIAILKDSSGGFILAGFVFAILNAIPFEKEEQTDVI